MAWFGKAADEPEASAPIGPDDPAREAAADDDAGDGPVTEEPTSDDAVTEGAAPPPPVAAPTLFLPEPLAEDPGVATAGAEVAPALEWTIKARPLVPEPLPRTPLQEKMAEIAEKHKNGPIEDMARPIREALAASGREVPDEWILAIAEGLRQHGPISLNLGGPGRAPS